MRLKKVHFFGPKGPLLGGSALPPPPKSILATGLIKSEDVNTIFFSQSYLFVGPPWKLVLVTEGATLYI